ncbi:MAG: hypothetical protein HYX80_08310 [Chloroflexi bacterium]|nr:hypothetical protein [Chloroflexota bacterium]
MLVTFDDVADMNRETARESGTPNIRMVYASRITPGPADVDAFIEATLEALTSPLTEEEKRGGKWSPKASRVLVEGTLDECETFFQQTRHVPPPLDAPIAIYTDGFPVRLPTEERVKEMLTGTSHKADELIVAQFDRKDARGNEIKAGDAIRFQPLKRTATVEQVAINAVMAGCKPEHLPVVLAMAESGTLNGDNVLIVVSGPVVKEIGMNTGNGFLDPGNPANSTIGRAGQLIAINLGGAVPGVNRMHASMGGPFNRGGMCIAENADALPEGWRGMNEEMGFEKNESIAMIFGPSGIQTNFGGQHSPGGYRALQKSGHGGMARRMDVKGIPGPHNFLEFHAFSLWANREGAYTFIIVPEMAKHLHDYGFKDKKDVYEWLWKKSFIPLKDYRNRSWPDLITNGWMGIEKTSGKHWKELPDDYMVPLVADPFDNCILIAGGPEEVILTLSGGRGGGGGTPHAFGVDAWR